jgi:nicotinate-nucleotide adenylyltransferase
MSRKLIFGGTFNPIHIGHLRAAVEALEAFGFDQVDWVPSYVPRHKRSSGLLSFDLRVELLRAATRGHKNFCINEIEKSLPVPSFTFQTLDALARNEPTAESYFLLGDREFLRLHQWFRGRDVVSRCHLIVACRTEFDLEAFASDGAKAWPDWRRLDPPTDAATAFELVPGRRAILLPLPRLDVSSSLVRQRWLQGQSLAHLLPSGAIELLDLHREEVRAIWGAKAASADVAS